MLKEVLDVARTCLVRRRHGENGIVGFVDGRGCESGSGPAGKSSSRVSDGYSLPGTASFVSGGSGPAITASTSTTGAAASLPGVGMNIDGYGSAPTLSIENMASSSSHSNEEDFFFSLFSQDPHHPPDRTRTEMLANLVDLSILEDFAFGGQELSFF